jgi:hypothetical protein
MEQVMNMDSAGRYTVRFPLRGHGLYIISTQGNFGTGRAQTLTTALAVPYPLEYRFYRENHPLIKQIASLTGGRVNPEPARTYDLPPTPQRFARDLWTLALLVALMLLMVDITVRRVMIAVPEVVAALVARLRWRRARRIAVTPFAERLRAAKQRATSRTPTFTTTQGQPHAVQSVPLKPPREASEIPTPTSPQAELPPDHDSPPEDTLGRLLKAKQRGTKR